MLFHHQPTEDQIRAVAYQIWEDEGRPDGRAEIHWQWALAQLEIKTNDTMPPEAVMVHTDELESREVSPHVEDVSLIGGIGPKIAEMLAEEGIGNLHQIAGMSVEEIEALDEKLGLHGRAMRDEWIAQAQELIAGNAPRAEIDRAKAS